MTSKHLAETADGLGTRLALVYRSLPDNPTKALVIRVDKMTRTVDRDELLIMATSERYLQLDNLAEVIHLHNPELLAYYHTNGLMETMDIDNIVQPFPNGTKVPLRTVVDSLNQQKGLAPLPKVHELENLSSANPKSQEFKDEAFDADNRKQIARNIFMQAQMMQNEVNKKLQEAYSMDPSLRLAGERLTNSVAAPIKVSSPATPTAPKKVIKKTKTKAKKVVKTTGTGKRGRPPKNPVAVTESVNNSGTTSLDV